MSCEGFFSEFQKTNGVTAFERLDIRVEIPTLQNTPRFVNSKWKVPQISALFEMVRTGRFELPTPRIPSEKNREQRGLRGFNELGDFRYGPEL
jgi:hypothetical protein